MYLFPSNEPIQQKNEAVLLKAKIYQEVNSLESSLWIGNLQKPKIFENLYFGSFFL